MKLNVNIHNSTVYIDEPSIEDSYRINKDGDTFHIESDNGYSTYEGGGFDSFEKAFKHVKKMITNYFVDRGEDEPKGWRAI